MKSPDSSIAINCDLGEDEPRERTEQLLTLIDLANIACGGHAGDQDSMRACLALARRHQVRPGAHPGPPDPARFGRGIDAPPDPARFVELLRAQVGGLAAIADVLGVRLHHVKLHGALYHATEADDALAHAYIREVDRSWPGLVIVALAGGRVVAEGRRLGVQVWDEAFLDRGYRDDGTLVPRTQPDALVSDPSAVAQRVIDLKTRGGWASVNGKWLRLEPRTLCVHADTPRALECLAAAQKALRTLG